MIHAPLQIEVIRANVIGTLNLADVTNEKGIHLTVYATGCIFHYDKDFPQDSGKGFTEDDTPNFTGSYYSKTKARHLYVHVMTVWYHKPARRALARNNRRQKYGCERQAAGTLNRHKGSSCMQALVEGLLKEFPNTLVLRVRMPIVADLTYPRNFITKIIKYDRVRPTAPSNVARWLQ